MHAAFKRMLLLMVLIAAAFLPKEAKAVSSGNAVSNDVVTYDLKLGDVAVTSENCNDIQFGQLCGTASYDAATKTLTLDSVKSKKKVFYSGIDGLKVKIKVFAVFFMEDGSATSIELKGNTVFDGNEADYLNMSTLSIGENTEVKFYNFNTMYASSMRGVSGEAGEKLVFENCYAEIAGTIINIASMTFDNCFLVNGVHFDEAKHEVVNTDGSLCDGFNIEMYEEYDLWVCGERVTKKNCYDLSKVPGFKKGIIYYNGSVNELRLSGCTIEAPEGVPAIRSAEENIRVVMQDSNSIITAKGAPVLKLEKGGSRIANFDCSLAISTSDDQPAILAENSLL